jgi:hypothetical protein
MKDYKIIEINTYINYNNYWDLIEEKTHPKHQEQKIIDLLHTGKQKIEVNTNSPYIAEALNKHGKKKGYRIIFKIDDHEVKAEDLFNEFSTPFENLVFD